MMSEALDKCLDALSERPELSPAYFEANIRFVTDKLESDIPIEVRCWPQLELREGGAKLAQISADHLDTIVENRRLTPS
jgi:hypothetical protein